MEHVSQKSSAPEPRNGRIEMLMKLGELSELGRFGVERRPSCESNQLLLLIAIEDCSTGKLLVKRLGTGWSA
jgi:hypothetical protein